MEEKYLSIITNFGCHYSCPYCIVKNNNLKIPKTTVEGLNKLKEEIKNNKINVVSISGGGDPLYNYFPTNVEYYKKLFSIVGDIPLELHTSYLGHTIPNKAFPMEKCYRVVYHIINPGFIKSIKRRGTEKVRIVFVVSENFTKSKIRRIYKSFCDNPDIDELSFRQMVDSNYQVTTYCQDYLRHFHKDKWHYIEQNDYNLYYCENRVSYKYEDFKK